MPGFQQITDCDPAVSLTVPSGAKRAIITADTASVRYRADGTAPTGTVGCLLVHAANGIVLEGQEVLQSVKFFSATGVLNVQYLSS